MSAGLTPNVELPNEERTVENPILDWLQSAELGWRYEDAKAVAREYRARRADGSVDEREVLLLPILKERLIALNPSIITDDQRAERVISRLRAERPKDNIRTDVLLFVNGIPIVDIEAKTTGRDWHLDWTEGAKQCGRYG